MVVEVVAAVLSLMDDGDAQFLVTLFFFSSTHLSCTISTYRFNESDRSGSTGSRGPSSSVSTSEFPPAPTLFSATEVQMGRSEGNGSAIIAFRAGLPFPTISRATGRRTAVSAWGARSAHAGPYSADASKSAVNRGACNVVPLAVAVVVCRGW